MRDADWAVSCNASRRQDNLSIPEKLTCYKESYYCMNTFRHLQFLSRAVQSYRCSNTAAMSDRQTRERIDMLIFLGFRSTSDGLAYLPRARHSLDFTSQSLAVPAHIPKTRGNNARKKVMDRHCKSRRCMQFLLLHG